MFGFISFRIGFIDHKGKISRCNMHTWHMHAIMLYIPPPRFFFSRFFPIVTLLSVRSLTQFDFLSSSGISLDTQFPIVTIRKKRREKK